MSSVLRLSHGVFKRRNYCNLYLLLVYAIVLPNGAKIAYIILIHGYCDDA
jgi:hypothetical protein